MQYNSRNEFRKYSPYVKILCVSPLPDDRAKVSKSVSRNGKVISSHYSIRPMSDKIRRLIMKLGW